MISNLSNSFRVLSMQNVAAKYSFATGHKFYLRDIHLHQPMLKSIEEKLGLPAKPKRPANPYFRFMNEVRPTVQAKNPKLNLNEIASLIGKMWRSLDVNKKEKYANGYSKEMVAHSDLMMKYKNSLSQEDAIKIKEARFEQKERKAVLLQKKKCQEFGKPKKPASGFFQFLHKQTGRQPKESTAKFATRMSAKWNALSAAEKAKYFLTPAEQANYKKALEEWEQKMRKLGHFDIVRSQVSSSPAAKPKSRSPRKSSAE